MKLKQILMGLTLSSTLLLASASFAGGEPDMSSSMIGMTAAERVASTPKGELKNPFTGDEAAIAEGKGLYFSKSCNGCHGGSAGGGMCPPISNEVFVYGSDDDTLFRLITLGSDNLAKAGYFRKGMEGVVGPMPPFGVGMDADSEPMIQKDEDVWKIIAWLRTQYRGRAERINW